MGDASLIAFWVVFAVAMGLVYASYMAQEHGDCLEYGQPTTTLMHTGKTLVPITTTPCMVRAR